ncbi:MAG: phosphate ABC transporter substrate-binding protein [Bacteroidetes bacterium]|nr:phosphate ABC transporter substrate-binding protein [Bacteroidota bacterium]
MKFPSTFLLVLVALISGCSGNKHSIKIKGSDTEVNLAVQLAEAFHPTHKGIFVSISGGGSGLGIASLLNGTADIANSSRSLNSKEREMFRDNDMDIDSFVFAQDAIAFVVSESLLIDTLTTDLLAQILSGELISWSSISNLDQPVNIYGRQSNSGTHAFIKHKLGIEFSPHAKQMNGNAQILEAIKVDPSGIGYVGAGYVQNGSMEGIKVLWIKAGSNGIAISPFDQERIARGEYYFQRPLFQYFRKKDRERISSFLEFEKTDKGVGLIKSSGYYPAHYER